MDRWMWKTGGVLAGLAVAAGAFGAHALRARLSAPMLAVWETAARYQMYHALALLLVAMAAGRESGGPWILPARLLVAGTILFSGSLYALALSGRGWLGAVTPLGGLCWLAAWALIVIRASPRQDAGVR
jgi:uncharacterized membrane protein YgdD (TMEM256/DUF423 family)